MFLENPWVLPDIRARVWHVPGPTIFQLSVVVSNNGPPNKLKYWIVQLFEDTLETLFGLPKWPFLLGKGLKNNTFSRFVKIGCIPKKFFLNLSNFNFQEIASIIILSPEQIDLSIPHNISSHCQKNQFRGFHPIFFFDQNFRSRKNIFLIWIFVSRVKISSGIQKSYLERRAMSATMLKIQFLKGVS